MSPQSSSALTASADQAALLPPYQVVEGEAGLVLTKAKKRSWTMHSRHLQRLAIDLNFFIAGRLTYEFEDIEPLGAYWESLHPDNVWGGR